MIFAREINASLTSLVKKIDAATSSNSSSRMGSFVVFLNDDSALEGQLKTLAEKEGIKNTVLSIDTNPAGPPGYEISKDAEVTVVLYNARVVKANHSFRKGELNAKAIEAILKDVPKILAKKEAPKN